MWHYGYNPKNKYKITWDEYKAVKKDKADFRTYCEQYGYNNNPRALETNYTAVTIIEQYGPLLFTGQGGVNAEGIRLIIDNIPWLNEEDKPSIIRKLAYYASMSISEQLKERQEDNHGQENKNRNNSRGSSKQGRKKV